MRVLVISAAYPPMQMGEASNTYFLCKHFADRDFDVHVLTSCGCQGGDDPRIKVHSIMRRWDWWHIIKLRSFLRRCAPDVVLLMYIGVIYHYHPMITFAATLLKRMFPDVTFVTRYESVFLGADPSRTSRAARFIRRIMVWWAGRKGVSYSSGTLLRDSDCVIALSERHRQLIIEESPLVRPKIEMIPPPPNLRVLENPNGTTRRRGRAKLGLCNTAFVIAFFGYIYRTKGVEYLLRAFQAVRQKKEAKLLLIGGKLDVDIEGNHDYVDRMQDLALTLGVTEDVIWTGSVKAVEEEGSLYLHAADLAVLPLLQGVQLNNSSLASIAAHGLPVVGTRGPLLDSAFVHGNNILLCEPRDSQALAAHIVKVMDNPSLMAALQNGVRQLAQDWFSWNKAIDRTIATFSRAKGVRT
jgi:glycosyltransferase involved in cell wall biosynthesis